MKKAQKIALTMLAAGFISSVSANETDLWRQSAIHVNGTWSKATENGLSFGDIPSNPLVIDTRRAVFVRPDTSFNWGIGYTYHLMCTKFRFFFHYDHFNDGHESNAAEDLINLGLPVAPFAFLPDGSGSVHNKSDEWTFGFDRRLAFGQCYVIDTAFFWEWDKVRRNFHERIVQSVPAGVARANRTTYNRFRGFGPGIGLKGRAVPFNCPSFGMFASLMGTLLYGKNHFISTSTQEINFQSTPFANYRLEPEETRSIVSKFDITFGLDYKRKFQLNCDDLQLGIALGMRYVNYINIFKNGNAFFNPLLPSPSVSLNTGHAEDWGRIGPFLQIRVGGGDA